MRLMGGANSTPKPFRITLDLKSGIPVYRQIDDQVMLGIVSGILGPGDQLPTVRQLAVDLSINPNTVVRAYRELESRGIIETHQKTGTFIGRSKLDRSDVERQRQLDQLARSFLTRAAEAGFTLKEIIQCLKAFQTDAEPRRKS